MEENAYSAIGRNPVGNVVMSPSTTTGSEYCTPRNYLKSTE